MNKYYIDNYEGKHDPNRFCVKTKSGNVFMDAMGQGYHTEDSAKRALYAHMSYCHKMSLRRKFFNIIYDKEGTYEGFLNYLKVRCGKTYPNDVCFCDKLKKKHVTKGREVCGVDLHMTDGEFYNRFVKFMRKESWLI